jgi:putative phosphoesterase
MKIAVISDIHGNHTALNEVLKAARQEKVEKLLVLGDICGYYYHPDEVLHMIEGWDHEFIRGNHERILLQIKNGEIEEETIRKKYGSGHKCALENLTDSEIKKITQAPDRLKLVFDDTGILMCHGSPINADQYLYPDSDELVLNDCDVEGVDFVLVGHSHYPFLIRNKSGLLINAGSVGQSRIAGGQASWVTINTANHVIEMRSTPYSTEKLEREIEINDPEVPYLREILKRNKN